MDPRLESNKRFCHICCDYELLTKISLSVSRRNTHNFTIIKKFYTSKNNRRKKKNIMFPADIEDGRIRDGRIRDGRIRDPPIEHQFKMTVCENFTCEKFLIRLLQIIAIILVAILIFVAAVCTRSECPPRYSDREPEWGKTINLCTSFADCSNWSP